MTIKELVEQSHALAVSKGWWPRSSSTAPTNIPEKLALIHSEVSEALEAYRDGDMVTRLQVTGFNQDSETPVMKPVGFPIELADVVIRVADLCGHLGIDLEDAIRVKHEYNRTRAYRHGGKKA
jgi:NTP pyrophosphatase (non-canonical NTP hydrolase)